MAIAPVTSLSRTDDGNEGGRGLRNPGGIDWRLPVPLPPSSLEVGEGAFEKGPWGVVAEEGDTASLEEAPCP